MLSQRNGQMQPNLNKDALCATLITQVTLSLLTLRVLLNIVEQEITMCQKL